VNQMVLVIKDSCVLVLTKLRLQLVLVLDLIVVVLAHKAITVQTKVQVIPIHVNLVHGNHCLANKLVTHVQRVSTVSLADSMILQHYQIVLLDTTAL
jgi:hypothetical protein